MAVVCRGAGRGKSLGFPTANLKVVSGSLPPDGVYAARVEFRGLVRGAAAVVGIPPTFEGDNAPAEVFILDFDGDLYGETIAVTFLEKLREQERFASTGELVEQISRDIASVRLILRRNSIEP